MFAVLVATVIRHGAEERLPICSDALEENIAHIAANVVPGRVQLGDRRVRHEATAHAYFIAVMISFANIHDAVELGPSAFAPLKHMLAISVLQIEAHNPLLAVDEHHEMERGGFKQLSPGFIFILADHNLPESRDAITLLRDEEGHGNPRAAWT